MASTAIPPPLLWLALIGAAAALAGGYFDDGWHTERGRDTFFIPPHIAIYGGITAVGASIALVVAMAILRDGRARVRCEGHLVLGAVAVLVTLASGPIDNLWHESFGRDSVIWSPPHMLGIIGTTALGAAILADVRERPVAGTFAAALVVAAMSFIVVEYETDVPQFHVRWYLPVLIAAAAVAFELVRLTRPEGWRLTLAAVTHLAFIALVSAGMWVAGFPPPAVPVLIVPALLLDLARRRGWPLPAEPALLAAGVYAAYVPTRNWLGGGVRIALEDVIVGLPLAAAAAAVVMAAARGGSRARGLPVAAIAAAALAVAVVVAGPVATAIAHDPGQGEDAGRVALQVRADGLTLRLEGMLASSRCADVRGGRVVARRAGLVREAELGFRDCRFSGEVAVPERGRWFLYAEMEAGSGPLEAWLPVRAGTSETLAEPDRYLYRPPERVAAAVQPVAGVTLYLLMAGLLLLSFRLLRQLAPAAG